MVPCDVGEPAGLLLPNVYVINEAHDYANKPTFCSYYSTLRPHRAIFFGMLAQPTAQHRLIVTQNCSVRDSKTKAMNGTRTQWLGTLANHTASQIALPSRRTVKRPLEKDPGNFPGAEWLHARNPSRS